MAGHLQAEGQHLGRVHLVPGPGACLARLGLPCSRGKPRQPSPSRLPPLVTLSVSSCVLRDSSQLGCTATVVEARTPCGHIPLTHRSTAYPGMQVHAALTRHWPLPANPGFPTSPACQPGFIKKKGQAPSWPAYAPRHKGTTFSPYPKGQVSQGLLLWWEDRGMASEPRSQGQRPQNSAPTHRRDQTPSPLAPRHLPRHSGVQEFLGYWIKIQPPPTVAVTAGKGHRAWCFISQAGLGSSVSEEC